VAAVLSLGSAQTIELESGWNHISINEIPTAPGDLEVANIFSTYPNIEQIVKGSKRAVNGGSTEGYESLTALNVNDAYWVQVAAGQTVNFSFPGTTVYPDDIRDNSGSTIDVLKTGWQNIGFANQAQSFDYYEDKVLEKGFRFEQVLYGNRKLYTTIAAEKLSRPTQTKGYWTNLNSTDPADIVAADKSFLDFSDIKNTNTSPDWITDALNLLSEGVKGSNITWASSDAGIINPATGAVTQGATDQEVTLTATIEKDGVTDTKDITLTVPSAGSVADYTDADMSAYNQVLNYDTTGLGFYNGATASMDLSTINIELYTNGTVENSYAGPTAEVDYSVKLDHDGDGVADSTLMVTPSYVSGGNFWLKDVSGGGAVNIASDFVIFGSTENIIDISNIETNEQSSTADVTAAHAALDFASIANGNADALIVTGDLTLPTLLNGAGISWQSSKPHVINPDTGAVTVTQNALKPVKLTATISSGQEVQTKEFDLVVQDGNFDVYTSGADVHTNNSAVDGIVGVFDSVNGYYTDLVQNQPAGSGAWSYVGNAGLSSAADIYAHPQLTTDANGDIISFWSEGNTIKIKRWDGSNWATVADGAGNINIKSGGADYINFDIAFDSSNNVYVAYANNDRFGRVSVKKWDGASWTSLGTEADSNANNSVNIVIDNTDTPYIIYRGTFDGFVLKLQSWDGSAWNDLDSSMRSNVVKAELYNNEIYIYMFDKDNNNYSSVQKWNGASWDKIGAGDITTAYTNLDISQSLLDFKVVDQNNIYATFKDANTGKAIVFAWDGASWSEITPASQPTAHYDYLDIAADSSSTILAYGREHSALGALSWDSGTTWSGLGSQDFISNQSKYLDIEIIDGVPYFVAKDADNSDQVSVLDIRSGTNQVSLSNGSILEDAPGISWQ
jgi:hypothetical protein